MTSEFETMFDETMFDDSNDSKVTKRIYSSYLLRPIQNDQKKSGDCELGNCKYLKQIIATLCIEEEKKINDKTYAKYLINSFHHVLLIHCNEFEEIYNILKKRYNINKSHDQMCQLSNCDMMKRTFRDRQSLADCELDVDTLYPNNNDSNDIITQQLIDTIHCYYFHSFDAGYRLNRDKIQEIEDKLKNEEKGTDEYYDVVVSELTKHIHNLNCTGCIRDKFILMPTEREEKQNKNGIFYSFAHRYFYWDFYKNNNDKYDPIISCKDQIQARQANSEYKLRDWFILSKFKSLKHEMLNNKICVISNKQWDIQYLKALSHLESDYFKSIRCKLKNDTVATKIYGIKYNCVITVSHVMAMMIYCNYDYLQSKLSETYRHIPFNETDDMLKLRHSNYYNLGKLLREVVECYGSSNEYIGNYVSFYHGISIQCNFQSINTSINGPLSTSTDITVAMNFATNRFEEKGMILELKLGYIGWNIGVSGSDNTVNNNYAFFECKVLSDYPAEQEIFFIGGMGQFKFQTIIDTTTAINYLYYIHAMGSIVEQLSYIGSRLYSDAKELSVLNRQQCTFRLLSHLFHKLYPDNQTFHPLKSLSKYVEQLLINHLGHVTYLMFPLIELNMFYDDNIDFKLIRMFFIDDNGWLKMDAITKIFVSLQKLVVQVDDSIIGNTSTFLSILDVLKNNKHNTLESIEVIYRTLSFGGDNVNLSEIVLIWKQEMYQVNWNMYLDEHENKIYLTKGANELDDIQQPLF
eukprot:302279_1